MTRLILFVVVCLAMVGCATTTISRTAIVKPTDSSNSEWSISAKAQTGHMSDKIIIYINEREIVRGALGLATTRNNFSAIYEGRKIDAECSLTEDGGMTLGHKCVIYIDSKKITELPF